MTSHYRHRRDNNAAAPFVPLETGEIAVNTANRQIAVGDIGGGSPLALIAVRYHDAKSQYALNDFVVHQADLYVALGPVPPGPFNASQWRLASTSPGDTSNLANYLLLAGGTMTGPLTLAGAPTSNLHAATKQYVDTAVPPPAASGVPVTPVGEIAATNVQAALAELDAEKVAKAGDTMTGHLALPTNPAAPNAVRKDYVDAADTANATLAGGKVSKSGDSMVGPLVVNSDIYAVRGPAAGIIFLGSNGGHYLFFDGATYRMPSGGLVVGGDLNAVGGSFGGQLNVNGGSNFPNNVAHTLYNNGVYFASAAGSTVMLQGPPYPTMSFHCAGYFAANFGMSTDGQFYMGGWSHGEGVAYRFITTRDGGEPVFNTRLVYIGDVDHGYGSALNEPSLGAVCTGLSGPSAYNAFTGRYRALQVRTAGGYYATETA